MNQRTAPYGAWTSPISAALAAQGSKRISDLTLWQGSLLWCEGRPEEGGRNVIVMAPGAGGDTIDLLPDGFSARSKVHEYGGGAFVVSEHGLFFVNGDDQDIYHLPKMDGAAIPIRVTNAPQMRFADGTYDPLRRRLIMVAERHPLPHSAAEVENLLVSIPVDGPARGQVQILASGRDFYAAPRLAPDAAPRLGPDSARLAWLEWSLPHMPWEASELWISGMGDDGGLHNPQPIASGEDCMAAEPQWGADGRLWFITDESGWASLNVHHQERQTALALQGCEFGQPMWGLGGQTYQINRNGSVDAIAQCEGQLKLLHHDGHGWSERPSPARQVDTLTGTGDGIGDEAGSGGDIYAVATTDLAATSVCNLITGGNISGHGSRLDQADISVAQPVSFSTGRDSTAHGLYYPPCNSHYAAPDGTAPPMIVSAHGGPTAMADRGLKLKIQFWTSRGFAWLDVDYRGSIGHGRAYRRALDGYWGVADVQDVAAGARHMADAGLADPDKLLISGSSAGGYTVLQALCETDIFAAGASYYGIGDLAKLLALTHKFESGYLRTLLGLTPQNQQQLLRARSPLFHAEKITCPVIFFQGGDDFVVPPDQSRDMAASLRDRGTPVAYVEFAGEGHGFRRSDSIITALTSEYAFYAAILGLEPEQVLAPIAIDNF